MKITALMDNRVSDSNKDLIVEHGLSYLIETPNGDIIFDCSQSQASWLNAQKLGVSFNNVQQIMISHGHYDHSTGFKSLVDYLPKKSMEFITGAGFFNEKYSIKNSEEIYRGNGYNEDFVTSHGLTHRTITDIEEIAPDCYAVTNFKRPYAFETIDGRFKLQTEQGFIDDTFTDEVCLVIKTTKGLVAIFGCSHPGVLNMLTTISEHFKMPICTLLGGTHLADADSERIATTLNRMQEFGIEKLLISHCSGDEAVEMAQTLEGLEAYPLCVGESFEF